MVKEKIAVSFSGGRTSGFMCNLLKQNMNHIYDLHFVYANTGLEHEKTLEFVDKVDKHFNLNLTWIEADIKNGRDASYKIVDFNTACRDNRLFKEMCDVYGLPNKSYPHCTRELKTRPMRKYCVDMFGYDYRSALGIRYDEPKRYNSDFKHIIQPLASIVKITKNDVLEFWKKQPFDLEIDEHYGNCVGCYKKSDKKLKMIADESPNYFNPFISLENNYPNSDRKIYRGYRTAHEVKHNLKLPKNLVILEECAEECGSILVEVEDNV